jgi:hypothetical protein
MDTTSDSKLANDAGRGGGGSERGGDDGDGDGDEDDFRLPIEVPPG